MKSTLPLLLVLAALGLPAAASPWAFIQVNDPRRNDVRNAVEAHRAATREEVRREEAAAGRRLTPAELAELRQQVRQQWAPRQDVIIQSAESQPAERAMPAPVPNSRVLPARSQRP
ncbi:MAG: hypothetical protein EOP82_20005 [Variovorax sp.]|nr:MAG: hypothetical protein EOP82_20005 [Variovorax sp.]